MPRPLGQRSGPTTNIFERVADYPNLLLVLLSTSLALLVNADVGSSQVTHELVCDPMLSVWQCQAHFVPLSCQHSDRFIIHTYVFIFSSTLLFMIFSIADVGST